MGSTFPRPMADRHHQKRVPVQPEAVPTVDGRTRTGPVFGTPCGHSAGSSRQAHHQGSSQGDSTRPDDTGILLPHLLGAQEVVIGDENDTQLEDLQRELPGRSSTFSTAITQRSERISTTQRLDGVHRPQRRLPTRTNQTETPEVPTFPIQRETLPVVGTTVRDCSGTMAVHQTDNTHSRMASSEGNTIPLLHGRLFGASSGQDRVAVTTKDHTTATTEAGMGAKHGEVRINTQEDSTVHRSYLYDRESLSPSTRRQMAVNPDADSSHHDRTRILEDVAEDVRVADVSSRGYSKRTSDVTTDPDVAKPAHSETTEGHPGVPQRIGDISQLVDSPVQRLTRDLFAAIPNYTSSVRRCIQNRMGSAHGDEDTLRALVRRRGRPSHQLPRAPSSDQGDRRLAGDTTGYDDDDRNRQHHCSGTHQQTRRNTFPSTTQPDDRILPTSRQVADESESTTHPGDNQRDSRCSIKTRSAKPHRMATTSGVLQVDLHTTVDTERGSVRNKVQQPAAGIHITDTRSGSTRRRRPFPKLGRFRRLRVPTDVSSSEVADEDTRGELSDDPHRSLLAQSPLVPGPHQFSTTESSTSSELEESTEGTTHKTAPPQPRPIRSARMDAVTTSLKKRGFSDRSAEAVLNVHRPSTRSVYDTRWKSFLKWCETKKIKPEIIPIPRIADFLIYLRDVRKLKAGSIGGYLSVVATVRNITTETRLSAIPELAAIIKGFKQEDQTKRFRPPEWDLGLVLQSLTGPPYEPLEEAPIDALTKKTIFLLAFATAARVSEIHALDFTQVQFDRGDTGAVHLGLLMNFVAKNQRPGQPPRRFTIGSINNILGPEDREDRTLCPVRALKRYIAVTRYSNRPTKRLFISCRPERTKDITKNTIAFWIRATILDAYKTSGKPPPSSQRPHELRALAATMAMHLNIPVMEIMKGCFWAGESTFSSYYLRDLSVEDVEGIKHLGPLVAAQSIINGPRPPRRR